MKTGIKGLGLLACAAALAAAVSTAQADGCDTADERKAVAQMGQAETLERDGKLREAFNVASRVDTMCVSEQRVVVLMQRVGKTLGGQEEQKGRLDDAFNWYSRARLEADADRVKLLQVKAQPEDIQVFGSAYGHFKYRKADSTLKELRALAAKNADKSLAEEERAFAARSDSFAELERAERWLGYLGDDQLKRKAQRAEQRGDALLEKDGLGMLEKALSYYDIADKPQKSQQVRDKALRLADAYAKAGETTTAVNFYNLAGADDKATALEKRAGQARQEKEARRQDQFKQEQDALEKELGF